MKTLRILTVTVLLAVVFMLPGCEKSLGEKPVVAVSIVPQKTFVEAVCGNLAEVAVMIPQGASPASYEPAPAEIKAFSRSEIYFTVGVPAEKAAILPAANQYDDLIVVKLQHEVARIYPDREFSPGKRDPHIWLSPKRVKVMIKVITDEMKHIDPKNSSTYEQNALTFLKELDSLDGRMTKALEGISNRKFIVFHPSFGYLADDYGLEMYSLEKDGKQATPQRLREMIDLARQEGIKAIFYQAEISARQAEAFAEEIGGKTVMLAPLSPDYVENLEKMAETMAEVLK